MQSIFDTRDANTHDDLVGLEEVEHVGEVRSHHQQVEREQRENRDDAVARDKRNFGRVEGTDAVVDPDRIDRGDDEHPDDGAIRTISKEHLRDARRVSRRGKLHDDGGDGDDDAQDRSDDFAGAAHDAAGIVGGHDAEKIRDGFLWCAG